MLNWIAGLILLMVKLGVVLGVMLFFAAYLVWAERKLLARLQVRYGPNRAGKFGLLQPIADTIKMITKEDIVPETADRVIFLLAPAVVAFTAPSHVCRGPLWTQHEDLGPGNTFGDIGSQRGALVCFRIILFRCLWCCPGRLGFQFKICPVGGYSGCCSDDQLRTLPGSLSGSHRHACPFFQPGGHCAGAGKLPLYSCSAGFIYYLFYQCHGGEQTDSIRSSRAENELGAGFHTEYSGMRFGLFFIGEYVHIQVLGALTAVFFLGGWRGPWLPAPMWLLLKIMLVALVMIWIRGTLPRLRYDQLMALGWKVLVPVALINILITGVFVLI